MVVPALSVSHFMIPLPSRFHTFRSFTYLFPPNPMYILLHKPFLYSRHSLLNKQIPILDFKSLQDAIAE
jgi:hypothetical protein